nr:hypothetical protein [uncultured Noviherbaspirillum sp.]
MYPSNSPGPHLIAGSVSSPHRPQSVNPESTTSPRSEQIRLTPRSPDPHPELNAALRMYDFYAIDRDFDSLREEVQPASKAARTSALPAVIGELQTNIKQSVLSAETSFKRCASEECRLYLTAAKSNQVLMLGKIDDIPESSLGAAKRTALRATCVALGRTLTRMLLQAKTQAAAAASEKERKRKARDGDDNDTPPVSPTANEQAHKAARSTPTRESRKRAQGDADSPVLAETSPKRQKAYGIVSPSIMPPAALTTTVSASISTTATTTTTFAATTGVLASPPSYQPAPSLKAEQETRSPVTGAGDSAPRSPTSKSSPRKARVISPQPKPRPRSQLFVAPPDFGTQLPDDALLRSGRTALFSPLPAVFGTAADATLANTDDAGHQL